MTTAESQTRLQMFQDSVTAGEEVKFTQPREPEANIPKQLINANQSHIEEQPFVTNFPN